MDRFRKDVDKTKDTIAGEYEKIKGREPADKTSEITGEALGNIERSLTALSEGIRKETYDLSSAAKRGVEQFGRELDELRSGIEKQRKRLREGDLYRKSELILLDIKNNYNQMVERYLKWP